MSDQHALLRVESVVKHFTVGSGMLGKPRTVYAVDGVSFTLARGETLSLVGESGCGKSTVGRSVLRLLEPTSGEIWLDGERIDQLHGSALRKMRSKMQMVFQDPYGSLNPRMTVRQIIAEPIMNFHAGASKSEIDDRVSDLLGKVGLRSDSADRLPKEFSGGQRQRVAIARALAPGAELIICDEAVSALDVSVKAQVINLLVELQDTLGLALLFISHDLAIVEHLTHRVAVMYLGKIVEIASRQDLFANPRHPYTRALLSAVPVPGRKKGQGRIVLRGELPSPSNPPTGCRFNTRCPYTFDRCRLEEPKLRAVGGDGQLAACHLDILPQVSNADLSTERLGG
jgi:peptide/nickel transport system ATP-binding protein